MKKALLLMLVAALTVSSAFATMNAASGLRITPPSNQHSRIQTLDDQCLIDFIGFTYGGYSGNTNWPGGGNTYYMTGFEFLRICGGDSDTLYAYCNDMDHSLYQDQYCVNIDPRVVNPLYPEQYPAMGYVMTWYPVVNTVDDQIMQLAIWKLSNDERTSSPTFHVPWYRIPNPFPFTLNTLYNTDPARNDPANQRDSLALGLTDGIPRNVYMCGDLLNASQGGAIISGGTATVPITINLTRGALANSVGNTSLGGVRVLVTTDYGTLSSGDVLTDASGNAYLTIQAPANSHTDAHVRICTKGLWPKSIVACGGEGYQQLLVQQLTNGELCERCIDLHVTGDSWEPAELASFTAVSGSEGIELAWRTTSETNLNRWEVERSNTGSAFRTVTQIAAANVATGHAYRYVDAEVQHNVTYSYRLVDVDFSGARTVHNMTAQASWANTVNNIPAAYELYTNYPNPFNPETRIRFALPEAGTVTLKVYDAVGHEVATLANGELSAGEHSVTFKGDNLPSGLYFYTLKSGAFTKTMKMVLMK